jgi:hypothetical protein
VSPKTKFVLQVVLSVFAFGLTWVVSNQAAIITAVTIAIVWLINTLAEYKGFKIGREYVTGALYGVAFLLVIIFNPGILPAVPVFPSDPVLVLSVLVAYLQAVVVALIPYTGAAMTIYNVLLRDVLDGISLPLFRTQLG